MLAIRLLIMSYNLVTDPRLKPLVTLPAPVGFPRFSILIPARNEAMALPELLIQLEQLTDPVWEVIVLNDESEDETESILKAAVDRMPSLRYRNGKPLPAGWLGKNWACHQLASEATGDYFLFLDADTTFLHPDLLSVVVPYFQRFELALLSLFPDQEMRGWGENSAVPLMHYLLLSWLPLRWVDQTRNPVFSAANGQFMCFEAGHYQKHQWHKIVQNSLIEDIDIMKSVKTAGLRGMTLLANGFVTNRMYHNYRDALSGFRKNLLQGFRNSFFLLGVYLIMTQFAWLVGLLFVPVKWIMLGATGFVLLRIGISFLARQSIGSNLVLFPLQMLTLTLIAILSVSSQTTKRLRWKGRNVYG